MFSLDVVRWRDRQQQQQPPPTSSRTTAATRKAKLPPTSSRVLAGGGELQQHHQPQRKQPQPQLSNDGDARTELPNVHVDDVDRRMKRLYGRTTKEMHTAYMQRVETWMHNAPKEKWTRDYAKEIYSRAYVPRDRSKAKELGGPMLKTGPYSPRGLYRGGGECIRLLPDAPNESSDDNNDPAKAMRDTYQPPIRIIEKSRYKDKEIQGPMSIPKNKSLECAHYFVEDVIAASPEPESERRKSPRRSSRGKPLSPLKAPPPTQRVDPPPTTAEYVALPKWRVHEPGKWVGGVFVSTVVSTTPHTAQCKSITGSTYSPTVLISEPFVPPHKRHPLSPKDAALLPREHDRRAQTAASVLREQRSPSKADRKYFTSMWTQPGSPSPGLCGPLSPEDGGTSHMMPTTTSIQEPRVATTAAGPGSPSTSPSNRGRALVLQIQAEQRSPTTRQQHQRRPQTVTAGTTGADVVPFEGA